MDKSMEKPNIFEVVEMQTQNELGKVEAKLAEMEINNERL